MLKTRVSPRIINKAQAALNEIETQIQHEGNHDGDDISCPLCRGYEDLAGEISKARLFPQSMHNQVEAIEQNLEGMMK